ncbi:hypothetical protein Patl1_23143 [Pistacia atlantica]|uniref:Uncharacterized protein n=1 Tax=Pistacia atlantica TaxID=434234 RepID=A0ACC1A2G4_9ROSI|nr:hypothetical protein Patl1_23143 [Pistacia atlantica]
MKISYGKLSNTYIEGHKRAELKIGIDEKLEPDSECCIYRVPTELRKINEAAYTPQLISIGPFHHGNKDLAEMEKQKVRYKKEFGERMIEENWEDFITFIEKEEQHIRNCYSETSPLKSLDFITMVLYDSIFIIELFLKFREHAGKKEDRSKFQECKDDVLLNKPYFEVGLKRDLLLLENQLPYFVLEELYRSTKFKVTVQGYPDFLTLSISFFHDSMCIIEEKPDYHPNVNQFTDLKRNSLLHTHPEDNVSFSVLPSAVKLEESGVKFTFLEGRCLLDIEPKQRNFIIPIPCFSGVELKIPCLEVEDNTETVIRNVMALEQCHYPLKTHVCNYISFMDFLIDTEKDVDLLIEEKIISNLMGDSAKIVQMFNGLGLNINLSQSCYSGIARVLNAHYDSGWNRKRATLKRVYFSNLWKGTGTIAAIILLLLTFIQTICSIKQVEWFQ